MNKRLKLILAGVLVLVSTTAPAAERAIDRVIALVDKDVVLASELVRRTNSVLQQLKKAGQKAPAENLLREQILDRLILESLQLQMAKRAGVRVSDAELDATIEKISQENNMSSEKFRELSIAEGTPWSIFREDIRKEIMISRVRGGTVSRRIKISDKEVDSLVAQIEKQGESRIQYSIGHILMPLPEGSMPEEVSQLGDKARNLIAELRAGASFEEYAATYSKGEKAFSGGHLGWRSLSQLPSLFADAIKRMKAGDISEPLRSGSGFHILKLIESKGGFETYKVMQSHIRHILITPNAILDDQAALDKIKMIRQRILDGEKFDELAIEFSDDKASGSLGGDMDWSNPGTYVPEFSKMADSLGINELSLPVKTQFGWHIIEVLGRRDQDQTEDKKREQAYRILHNRKFEEEAQIWQQEIKQQAYIKLIKQ